MRYVVLEGINISEVRTHQILVDENSLDDSTSSYEDFFVAGKFKDIKRVAVVEITCVEGRWVEEEVYESE